MPVSGRSVRLILNGKRAADPAVRLAVETVRQEGHPIDVRVTWEGSDAARFAVDALQQGVDLIIAGGGDGTVSQVVSGIFSVTDTPQSAMAVLPLGSANDFATGCGVPIGNPLAALRLAVTGEARPIDVGRINDRTFINALIVGFGAEVTFKTSDEMKKLLGGAAYGLTGLLTALRQVEYRGMVTSEEGEVESSVVFAAFGNGIQAGGAQLTPRAKLDDGKFDVCSIPYQALWHIPTVIREIRRLKTDEPKLVRYRQRAWLEVKATGPVPISPDGEDMIAQHLRVEMLHRRLPFVLPAGAPLEANVAS